jgi:hypothetical protein
MAEIPKEPNLLLQLNECRRHSDNHRRSRDYHKEQSAKLRKEIIELMDTNEFWHIQHSKMEDAYQEAHRHHQAWMTFSIIAAAYGVAMTVLFAWAIRL